MAGGKNSQTGFQPVIIINVKYLKLRYFICIYNVSFSLKDSDVDITYEEQQTINKFARQNAKLEDYKEELKLKQVIFEQKDHLWNICFSLHYTHTHTHFSLRKIFTLYTYICISTHIYNVQNELKNLEDASDELELMDDDEKIPYYVGEVFVYQSLEKTQVNQMCLTVKNVILLSLRKNYCLFTFYQLLYKSNWWLFS